MLLNIQMPCLISTVFSEILANSILHLNPFLIAESSPLTLTQGDVLGAGPWWLCWNWSTSSLPMHLGWTMPLHPHCPFFRIKYIPPSHESQTLWWTLCYPTCNPDRPGSQAKQPWNFKQALYHVFIGGFLEHFHLVSVTWEGSSCYKPAQSETEWHQLGQCDPTQLLPLQ